MSNLWMGDAKIPILIEFIKALYFNYDSHILQNKINEKTYTGIFRKFTNIYYYGLSKL